MRNLIDISGLPKTMVLQALYNRARPQGMEFLHFTPEDMPFEEADAIIGEGILRYDYLKGRVMKVNIQGDELKASAYNHANGEQAAETAIMDLRDRMMGEEV